jgi:hypothetical protein
MASLDEVLDGAEDEIELDLSGAVEFGDAPYGKYIAKLDRYETGRSKKRDDGGDEPLVKWYFQVHKTLEVHEHVVDEDGNETDELREEPPEGTFLPIVNTMLVGAGAGRTRELIEARGGSVKDKDAKGKTKISPASVVGNFVRCVKQKQPNNEQYDELTGFEKVTSKSSLA